MSSRAPTLVSRRQLLALAAASAGGLALGRTAFGPRIAAQLAHLLQPASVAREYPAYSRETGGGWLKFAGNPVLGGRLGTCFDPCVLRDRGLFRMWFSWRPKGSIALVESRDGVHWSAPRIVLGPGASGSWETIVNRACVVKMGGRYLMWYTGQTSEESHLGCAVSLDGYQWSRVSQEPVLTATAGWEKRSVMTPSVLYDHETRRFQLWYSAGDQFEPDAIGSAWSEDGLRWTRYSTDPIFTHGKRDTWDQAKVTAPQVARTSGWYTMFYIGFYNEMSAEIGIARSRNGLTNWKRSPNNPIVRPGLRASAWDYSAAYRPWALELGDRWMLWYNGRRGSLEQIGLATHLGSDLGFD